MILSGIQVMLPALGLEWYNEYEQNLEEINYKNNVYVSLQIGIMNN